MRLGANKLLQRLLARSRAAVATSPSSRISAGIARCTRAMRGQRLALRIITRTKPQTARLPLVFPAGRYLILPSCAEERRRGAAQDDLPGFGGDQHRRPSRLVHVRSLCAKRGGPHFLFPLSSSSSNPAPGAPVVGRSLARCLMTLVYSIDDWMAKGSLYRLFLHID